MVGEKYRTVVSNSDAVRGLKTVGFMENSQIVLSNIDQTNVFSKKLNTYLYK